MRRVYTVTVDIQPTDQVIDPDDGEQGDIWEAEMAYWEDVIQTAMSQIDYTYRKCIERAEMNVDYETIDYTNISFSVEDIDEGS